MPTIIDVAVIFDQSISNIEGIEERKNEVISIPIIVPENIPTAIFLIIWGKFL
jgi:hypothetical protein|uniref:Uncharacterized protein n=1 Tax=uncultured Flavobacteriia bacterium TaxID=212695 RepID=H6REF4_9BACT|nr:hypothetical protein [uncultured bacterium]CCF99415.1 hypothetical protein VIS_S3BDA80008 [uncultured Flavobacteriia bacterium]